MLTVPEASRAVSLRKKKVVNLKRAVAVPAAAAAEPKPVFQAEESVQTTRSGRRVFKKQR